MVIHVEFILTDYLYNYTGDMNIDVVNGACNISAQLAQLGLNYHTDYWFNSAYLTPTGVRYIIFGFTDPGDAMLIKIRGLIKING